MTTHPSKVELFSWRNLFPTGGKYTDEPTEVLWAPVTLWHRDKDLSSNLVTPQLKKDRRFLLAIELYVADMLILKGERKNYNNGTVSWEYIYFCSIKQN